MVEISVGWKYERKNIRGSKICFTHLGEEERK
jgi:hypothetical protein